MPSCTKAHEMTAIRLFHAMPLTGSSSHVKRDILEALNVFETFSDAGEKGDQQTNVMAAS